MGAWRCSARTAWSQHRPARDEWPRRHFALRRVRRRARRDGHAALHWEPRNKTAGLGGIRVMQWRISSLVKTFVSPDSSLGELDAQSVATLIATASDIALVVDADGTIRDIAFQSEELADDLDGSGGWVGRKLMATVVPDSRPKVTHLLADAAAHNTKPKWRHLNHAALDGRSIPVLYCAVQVGQDGRMVAFGRDLRAMSSLQQKLMTAQEALERDYSRMREVEARYRLLFQMSSEAVLILDTVRHRVVEANPAARALFGGRADQASGQALGDIFSPDTLDSIAAHLGAIRADGRAEEFTARLAGDGAEVLVAASLFRQENATLFLVRISPAPADTTRVPDVKRKLLRLVESAPDGFVVTDSTGNILTANNAFLEMAGLADEDMARGESLDRWVGTSGVELDLLITNLRQRGSVRFFTTTVRGEDTASAQVEISAVSIGNGGQPSFGFAIRAIGPRLQVEPRASRPLPRSIEQLTELIGRVPLKDLVRESTDVIEKLCIEAALELTGDNRASAAEMLGLSRQSLYVKLRRYGLGDLATNEQN
jgi:transcriptional regulator PpsR